MFHDNIIDVSRTYPVVTVGINVIHTMQYPRQYHQAYPTSGLFLGLPRVLEWFLLETFRFRLPSFSLPKFRSSSPVIFGLDCEVTNGRVSHYKVQWSSLFCPLVALCRTLRFVNCIVLRTTASTV